MEILHSLIGEYELAYFPQKFSDTIEIIAPNSGGGSSNLIRVFHFDNPQFLGLMEETEAPILEKISNQWDSLPSF